MDEVTKLLKSLSARMERIELEGKKSYKNPPNVDNRGSFKRPTNAPQTIQRDQRGRDRDDQIIQAPLQNNLVTYEEEEEEEVDLKIHCLGDTSSFPHLTQSAYEESLMDNQLNELSKGEKTSHTPNRYNLRSKQKEGKSDIPDRPTRAEKPAKDIADRSKEKKAQTPPLVVKSLVPEVREILNPPPLSSLSMKYKILESLYPFHGWSSMKTSKGASPNVAARTFVSFHRLSKPPR
jgi:hypothetical protein